MIYQTKADYRRAWDNANREDPPVPLCVDIELAAACNAKCGFCLYGNEDWRKSMEQPDWDGKAKRRFMPTDMAIAIIDECADIGVPSIKFNVRGESTLHKDFSKIIEHAARKITDSEGWAKFGAAAGDHTGRKVFHELLVNTNANCTLGALDGLRAATKVMVSLDSMDPEIYPKIRVGLKLQDAKDTIDALTGCGHPNIWVRRVICDLNREEDFVGAVKTEWGDAVHVSEHFVFERNEDAGAIPGQGWERQYCGYVSQRLVIEASGTVQPCCIVWESELTVGRYPEQSILDIWNGRTIKTLRSQLKKNLFVNEKCKNCTSFMAFKRPESAFVQHVEAK